jgi:hypothetical protein
VFQESEKFLPLKTLEDHSGSKQLRDNSFRPVGTSEISWESIVRLRLWLVAVLGCFVFSGGVNAQQVVAPSAAKAPAEYETRYEREIVGTVVAYSPNATNAPRGAHVILQTTAGALDVHLGDPRLLSANHFDIQNGDTLRVTGEYVRSGNLTQFVARIVQKGTEALAVRTVRGFPTPYVAPRMSGAQSSQRGVL